MRDKTGRKSIWRLLLILLGAALTFIGIGIASLVRDSLLQWLKPRLAGLVALLGRQPLPVRIGVGCVIFLIVALAVWIVVIASSIRARMRAVSFSSTVDAVLGRPVTSLVAALLEMRDDVRKLVDYFRPGKESPARPSEVGAVGQEPRPPEDPELQSLPVIHTEHSLHFTPPIDQNKLPDPPEHLIGRDRDLQWAVQRLLAPQDVKPHVTVITGMLGIGKTALVAAAVQHARQSHPERFAAGIAAFRCGDVTDAALILQKVLERFDGQRHRPPLALVTDVAQSLLREKDALIILDDVGPTVNIGEIITTLNVDGPHIVFTMRGGLSRDALTAIGQDAVCELVLLSPDDALALFAGAYGRQGIGDMTPDEIQQAGRIVETLERHTLSIQYIAAYAKALKRPLAVVADELANQRGQYANTPPPYILAIQQSLSVLPDSEKKLLAALEAFAGEEYGRDAVIAMGEGIGIEHPQDAVDELVRRFLVMQETNDRLPQRSYWERLRVHSTLRAHFGVLFKDLPPDTQLAAYRAVARHYADRVEAVAAQMRENQLHQRTQENRNEQRVLSADPKNITGALKWAKSAGEDELVMKLCNGMSSYWRDRWLTDDALTYLPWGIAAAEALVKKTHDPDDQRRLANLEFTYASVLRRIGDLIHAEWVFRKVRHVRHRENNTRGEAEVWYQLGIIAAIQRRFDQAESYFMRCLYAARVLNSPRDQSIVLSQVGRVARARGQLPRAEDLFKQSLAITNELPQSQRDQRLVGVTLGYLGRVARARGQLNEAEDLFKQSLAIARDKEEPDRRGEGRVLSHLGRVERTRGQLNEAEQHFLEALTIAREVRDKQSEGACHGYLGRIALAQAQAAPKNSLDAQSYFEAARKHFEKSREIAEEIQDLRGVSISDSQLGRVAFEQRRLREASRRFHQSLRQSRRIGDRQSEGVNLYRLGRLAERRGRTWWAGRLYRRALAIAKHVDNQADVADALLALGRVSAARRGTQQQGCAMLRESARIYAEMDVPKLAEARSELEKSGCG